jgi:hypothetical protein
MSKYFQVLTPNESIFDGTHIIDAAVSTAVPGNLVTLASDGELTLCVQAGTPFGILIRSTSYDVMKPSYNYAESVDEFRAGSYAAVVRGHFEAQVDAAGFHGAAVPAVGSLVYTSVSGLLGTSSAGSATKIGVVTGNDTIQGAWNAASTVARIAFEIPGF